MAPTLADEPARTADADDDGGWGAAAIVLLISATVLGATTAGMMGRRRRDEPDSDLPEQPVAAASDDPPPGAAPPDPAAAWRAEVDWRQEDDQARFRVVALRVDARDAVVVAESDPFAWPPTEDGGVQALTAAVDRLEAALVDAGWSVLAPGGAWYARRFEWAPVAEPRPERRKQRAPAPKQRSAPAPKQRLTAAEQRHLALAAQEVSADAEQQASGRFGRNRAWPEGTEDRWRCEIGWSAGLLHARFQAVAYPPGSRHGSPIGRTGALTSLLMADADPADVGHRQAVRRLAAALQAAGWSPAGRGTRWYAGRYVWRGDDDPPELLELDTETTPERAGAGPRRQRKEAT